MPTRPVLFGTFFTSQSIVSYVSLLSSVPAWPECGGRFMSNVPPEPNRPRVSCSTWVYPSRPRRLALRAMRVAEPPVPHGGRPSRVGGDPPALLGGPRTAGGPTPARHA